MSCILPSPNVYPCNSGPVVLWPPHERRMLRRNLRQLAQIGARGVNVTPAVQDQIDIYVDSKKRKPKHRGKQDEALLAEKLGPQGLARVEKLGWRRPNPLTPAAAAGALRQVQGLVDRGEAALNEEDGRSGRTPLQAAAENGRVDVVRDLLGRAGIECDRRTRAEGLTALALAAQNGHLDVVDALLAHGADPNLCTERGVALHAGVLGGSAAVVRRLIDVTAPGLMYSTLQTSSPTVLSDGQPEIASLLVQHRHALRLPLAGNTIVLAALVARHRQHVLRFIRVHAPDLSLDATNDVTLLLGLLTGAVDYRDHRGDTLLHHAVRKGDDVVTDVLLAAGSDPCSRNGRGLTPAQQTGSAALRQRLAEARCEELRVRAQQLRHLTKVDTSPLDEQEKNILNRRLLDLLRDNGQALGLSERDLLQLRDSFALQAVLSCRNLNGRDKARVLRGRLGTPGWWLLSLDGGRHHVSCLVWGEGEPLRCYVGDRGRRPNPWVSWTGAGRTPNALQCVTVSDAEALVRLLVDHGRESYEGLMAAVRGLGPMRTVGIRKGWQGTFSNCVTQSDTLTLTYVLSQSSRGRGAAKLLKALRIADLVADLWRGTDTPPAAGHGGAEALAAESRWRGDASRCLSEYLERHPSAFDGVSMPQATRAALQGATRSQKDGE